jgi:hypothetical protein
VTMVPHHDPFTVYDVAPVEAPQLNVGVFETFFAPLAGDIKVGAAGGAWTVVNDRASDQSLNSPP